MVIEEDAEEDDEDVDDEADDAVVIEEDAEEDDDEEEEDIRHAPRGCSRGGYGSWGCTRDGLWISFKILHVARLMNSSMISATSSMDALFF